MPWPPPARIALVLLVVLAGCGGGGEDVAEGLSTPVPRPVDTSTTPDATEPTATATATPTPTEPQATEDATDEATETAPPPVAPAEQGRLVIELDGDLVLVAPDGSGQEPLVTGPGTDFQPTWSPDGSAVAFTRDVQGSTELHVVDVATGETRQLTSGSTDLDPTWTPDGAAVLFTRLASDGSDLWRVGLDGSEPAPLGVLGALEEIGAPLPAALQQADAHPTAGLVFHLNAENVSAGAIDLYVTTLEGTDAELLEGNPSRDFHPRWLPDGDEVVFASDRSGSRQLWRVGRDSDAEQVPTDEEIVDPEPSPCGDHVVVQVLDAFGADRPGVGIIPLDGEGGLEIVLEGSGPNWDPSACPASSG